MCEKQRSSSRQVIVTVSGGVADVIFKPKGVGVDIFDYDVDREDEARLDRDPDGAYCSISHWAPEQAVAFNETWPIVRQAARDATCPCSRQWKCPDCGKTIDHTYEALADVGIPICGDCDCDMEMI